MSLLEATDLVKRFGGLLAVDGVSLSVPEARITSLIGPNGAGKTTVFNCLTGLLEPDQGSVRRYGMDVASAIARLNGTKSALEPTGHAP